ncbi:MAG TPA: AAA family ATPase [Candidatus Saccharimonadaceae bacterium]|nr:AAA family ATPase [Candidatus Saccharimonadaceae bacterium]
MTDDVNTANPFAPALPRQFFLETIGAGEALRRLDDGLGQREPFLIVTGEPGIGKSALANEAVARWGPRVLAAYLAFPATTRDELLGEILRRFGAEPADGAGGAKWIACLEAALLKISDRSQVPIVVVDDAHLLSRELLDTLRLLVNAAQQAGRSLEVLLVGLPSLEAAIDDPALAALRQRVSVRARLEPLSAGETRRYIRHRVTLAGGDGSTLFSRKTCAEIATLSHGVPRAINALAGDALRLARAAGRLAVEPEHVRNAVTALSGVLPKAAAGEFADDDTAPPVSARPAAAKVAAPAPVVKPVAAPPPVVAAPPPAVAAPAVAAPVAAASKPAVAAPPAFAAPPAAAAKPVIPAPSVTATTSAQPPTPAAPPRAPEKSVAPAVASAPAERVTAPHVPPAEFTSAPAASNVAPIETASQDPHEWVARFIGDKGPLKIGSQVGADTTWEPLLESGSVESAAAEPIDAPANASAKTPDRRRDRPGHGHRRRTDRPGGVVLQWRQPFGRGFRVAMAAGFAVLALIFFGLRAVNKGRSVVAAPASVEPAGGEAPAATSSRAPEASRAAHGQAAARNRAESADGAAPTLKAPYTIEVAARLDLDRAFEERRRLQDLTGIEGWVVPGTQPDAHDYRVVLGIFRSYAKTRSAAEMLVRSRTLPHATVVSLPSHSVRQ